MNDAKIPVLILNPNNNKVFGSTTGGAINQLFSFYNNLDSIIKLSVLKEQAGLSNKAWDKGMKGLESKR